MSQAAARLIVETMIRQIDAHGELLRTIETLCTPEEFSAHRLAIGHCSVALVEMLNPILDRYPDLRPPEADQEP